MKSSECAGESNSDGFSVLAVFCPWDETLKINHHWKGCLETGKLLFLFWEELGLCLCFVFSWKRSVFWKQFWALSPPLWEAFPHFGSTSWVGIYSSMNFSQQQQQCWLIWTLLSQYLTHFTSALKINFALTKAECSCEPDAVGAPCRRCCSFYSAPVCPCRCFIWDVFSALKPRDTN